MDIARVDLAALRGCIQEPSEWVCCRTSSTDNLWLCLSDGLIMTWSVAKKHAADTDSPLLMKLNSDAHEVVRVHKRGRAVATVPLSEADANSAPLPGLRALLDELLGVTVAPECGPAPSRAARQERLAAIHQLKTMGQEAIDERRRRDLQATAITRMLHVDLYRAFRSLKASLSPAATGLASRLVKDDLAAGRAPGSMDSAPPRATERRARRSRGEEGEAGEAGEEDEEDEEEKEGGGGRESRKRARPDDEARAGEAATAAERSLAMPPPQAPIMRTISTIAEDAVQAFVSYRQAVSASSRSGVFPGRVGLRNLGNTCYMNAVVQCLSNIPAFRELFFLWRHPVSAAAHPEEAEEPRLAAAEGSSDAAHDWVEKRSLVLELHALLAQMWRAPHLLSVYSPDPFRRAMWAALPRFAGFRQRDADEFLRELLDTCTAVLPPPEAPAAGDSAVGGAATSTPTPRAATRGSAVMERVCGGSTIRTVRCSSCGYESKSRNPFVGPFSLEIDAAQPAQDAPRGRSRRQAHAAVTLDDCLRGVTAETQLQDYACDGCGKRTNAVTSTRFEEPLPPVLFFHISRVLYTAEGVAKDQRHVEAPLTALSLRPYLQAAAGPGGKSAGADAPAAHADLRYDCTGIVVHHGKRPQEGHYTAVVYNSAAQQWVDCNDQRVRAASDAAVRRMQPYLLVYSRADLVHGDEGLRATVRLLARLLREAGSDVDHGPASQSPRSRATAAMAGSDGSDSDVEESGQSRGLRRALV